MRHHTAIDWNAVEGRARSMTNAALAWARRDCDETARLWDHAEYEHERENAGRYRDEGTVYARELERRAKKAARAAS